MAEAMSKSAKKRAAKKARDEAGPPAPEAAPKAAPKPKAEPKAKAVAAVPAPEPKAQPKAKADAKAKAKKKAEPEAAAPSKPKSDLDPIYMKVMDDGTGGDWSTSSGKSKKDERRQSKKQQDEQDKVKRDADQRAADKTSMKAGATFAATQQYGSMSETEKIIAKAKELAGREVTVKQDGSKTEGTEEKKPPQSTASVEVPEEKIGHVIGPGGKNLKMITEKTGVTRIDTEGCNFVAIGEPDAVKKAEKAIREIVEKGYCSLAYDDFEGADVMAYPQCFPDLIGKGGEIIQKIKKELGVEISIPKVPPKAAAYKKYPVGVAGSKEQVKLAKEVLESIIMYYHHPVTHEGIEHLEMDTIESWQYSFIIGKQGSELKHIQNNFQVRLYIPREFSANQNVVITGSKVACEKTKTYIEKLIAKASEPRGRGAADKADDHFGPDGDEEPWMSQYMYSRKK